MENSETKVPTFDQIPLMMANLLEDNKILANKIDILYRIIDMSVPKEKDDANERMDITAAQKKKVETMALKAFKALNAKGAVRIDFIIDEETGEVYVNEINSIPGSLAFYLWSEVGIDFSRECDELIQNALKMYREKQKKTYSFDTNILSSFKKRG